MTGNIAQTVADLDTRYQAAVKINDAETMASILHEEMILVRGNGDVVTRAQILAGARNEDSTFEVQDEEPGSQQVRVWGNDTAVVTAKLRIKGTRRTGEAFDRTVWFSDTYVRTPSGWRYAFAQVAPLS